MAEVEDLDEELMVDVYEKGLKKGRITESSDGLRSTLSDIRLMTVSKITNGAVALFAKETRRLLPQCRIRIQLMLKGKTASQFDDTYTIEGNIFTALEQTIAYFKDRLPRVSLFYADKTGRYDDLVYQSIKQFSQIFARAENNLAVIALKCPNIRVTIVDVNEKKLRHGILIILLICLYVNRD